MRYNLLVQEENNGVLESIVDSTDGKLVIVSDNSFVISTIVEELKDGALAGGFNLYNGDRLINPNIYSDVKIIVACVKDIKTFTHPVIDNTYHVAFLTRDKIDSFVFDIEVKPAVSCIIFDKQYELFNDETAAALEIHSSEDKSNNDIVESLKSHNVVFIQNITSNVVELIKANRNSMLIVNRVNYLVEEYVNNRNEEDLIILNYSCPAHGDVEYYDNLHIIADIIKSGVIFVCDTSWVRLFLELTSIKDDINLTSVVIYNTTDLGPMGNTPLYRISK